jgi:hypothetical protein
MHTEPKALLRASIEHCLPIAQRIAAEQVAGAAADAAQPPSTGQHERGIARAIVFELEEFEAPAQAFVKSFFSKHPEYKGLVGTPRARTNLATDPTYLVRAVLGYIWTKHLTFQLDAAKLDSVVEDFEEFVDSPSVPFRFRADLANFSSTVDRVELPEAIEIRRMTQDEVAYLRRTLELVRPEVFGTREFCVEGPGEEPKLFATSPDTVIEDDPIRDKLEKVLLSLRTFKAGRVGCDFVQFLPCGFCPLPLTTTGFSEMTVLFGRYNISSDEAADLVIHGERVFSLREEAMALACRRLGEAEQRTRPHDAIIDAVIGMEAILLAGIESGNRKGELSFRFSLNYAMRFSPTERRNAYRLARDLYGLRSTIAPGGSIDALKLKIAGEKVSLQHAAKRATSTLRDLIHHFLPKSGHPYKNPEFWEHQYFGLPESS